MLFIYSKLYQSVAYNCSTMMFLYVLILQKLFNSVRWLCKCRFTTYEIWSVELLRKKTTILIGLQSFLYSQLIYFTYIYLSEARIRLNIVKISENFSLTPKRHFTSPKELLRADQSTCT